MLYHNRIVNACNVDGKQMPKTFQCMKKEHVNSQSNAIVQLKKMKHTMKKKIGKKLKRNEKKNFVNACD